MIEIFGALSGDAKSARPGVEDTGAARRSDSPEFATVVQGQPEEVKAGLGALIGGMARADIDEMAGSQNDQEPELSGPVDEQDSFPILVARGEAKAAVAHGVVIDGDQTPPAAVAFGSEFEAEANTEEPSVLQQMDGVRAAESMLDNDLVQPLAKTPVQSVSDHSDTDQPDTIDLRSKVIGAKTDTPLVQPRQPDDSGLRAPPADAHDGAEKMPISHVRIQPEEGVEPRKARLDDVDSQHLTRATGVDSRQSLPASSYVGHDAPLKPKTGQQNGSSQGWVTVQSVKNAKLVEGETDVLETRTQQTVQTQSAGFPVNATPVLGQVVAAPVHLKGQRSDDPILKWAEKETSALDTALGDLRGAERSLGSTSLAPSGTARAELPAHVAQQLAQALRGSPRGAVEVALHPEELGRVKMTISASEAGVVISISAERQETFDMMRRHAASLSKELNDLGFDSVDLSFEQRDERNARTHEETDSRAVSKGGLLEGHLGLNHPSGLSVSDGLDRTKALDMRI